MYAFGEPVEDAHVIRKMQDIEKTKDMANVKSDFEKPEFNEIEPFADEDYMDIICSRCKKTLFFINDATERTCPLCGTKIKMN